MLETEIALNSGGRATIPAPLADDPWLNMKLTSRSRFMNATYCLPVDRTPVWMMRQAGRCLPEYRALKEKYSFHDLINSPELATEVTLQPVRRFDVDAAILFSDILVVPEAMGQGFSFRDSGGVHMNSAMKSKSDVEKLDPNRVRDSLRHVGATLRMIRQELGGRSALIGFAGSPWTLANFMLEGGSSKNFQKANELFANDSATFNLLAEKLTDGVTEFLNLQIDSGADAVQIFDTLGGLLPTADFEVASGRWLRKIVSGLNRRVPVIVFSKGTRDWATLRSLGAEVIGIDQDIDLGDAVDQLPGLAVQGNFNPELLANGTPETVASEATRLLTLMRGRDGYIFNLGHGVPPNAAMENLEALIYTVQHFV